jgi:integrase/recombinase XerD
VSFHVARHSYADFARTRSGDLFAISKALGHASLQITQTYLKSFDRDAVDRLSEQLWT